jgi:hypothetical protein
MRPWLPIAALLFARAAFAQVPVTGRVIDETGAAVSGARVEFHSPEFTGAASSDRAGNFHLTLPAPGDYAIRADRLGFFRFQAKPAPFDSARELTITLNHQQEFSERIDVTASSPAIDPTQPSEHKELDNTEIQTVPYPAQQDYRNALPMNDGIVQDNAARPHVNGARTSQTNYTLDGFNLSDPVTGRLDARLNIDSIQAMDLQTSRFAAENGRGAAGVVDLHTKMGDDTLRFAGTNIIPGISNSPGRSRRAAPGFTTAWTSSIATIPSMASPTARTVPPASPGATSPASRSTLPPPTS